MRSSRTLGLSLVLALASCQTALPQSGKLAGGAGAKLPASGAATPMPAGVLAKPAPAQLLRKPTGTTTTLSGVVALDAGYATVHGGGHLLAGLKGQAVGIDGAKVISNDGGSVISNDGGSVISNDGGTLVNAGGQIVAAGGGNIVVPAGLLTNDGGSLITDDAGNLISNDGGGIIAQGGGNIIAQGGGNVIAQGGSHYALAQTAGAPEYGKALPAAGMWVSVVDLKSGLALSLGNDASGKPVHTIYTDASGKFTVNLPSSASGNVRVVARAPGHSDGRLVLNVLAPSKGNVPTAVNESLATVTQYMRYVVADKLLLLASASPAQVASVFGRAAKPAIGASPNANDDMALSALVLGPLQDMQTAMHDAGIFKLPLQRQKELALLATDRLFAEMDLAGVKTDFSAYKPRRNSSLAFVDHSAVANLEIVFEKIRQKTVEISAKQADPEAYFAAKPFLIAANVGLAPEAAYDIKKASDMSDYMVRAYLSQNDHGLLDVVDHVIYDLGLPLEENDRLRAAGLSLSTALITRLVAGTTTGADGKETTVLQSIKDVLRVASKSTPAVPQPIAALPVPVPPSSSSPTQEPPGTVTTIAGRPGDSPLLDGDGATARFNGPSALVLDPNGKLPIFYLSDMNNAAIRRIKLDASGNALVDTVYQESPKTDDNAIVGFAIAPDSSLYFSNKKKNGIFHLTFTSAGPLVEPLTGIGAPGYLDGPAVNAKFNEPSGLRFTPTGDLLVADAGNFRVRRIALSEPNHPVTTLMGDGSNNSDDALQAQNASVDIPNQLVFGPDHTLYISQFLAGTVRALAAPGDATSATRFVAGGGSAAGSIDGFYANAYIGFIYGLAFDVPHNRLIASGFPSRLRAITPAGDVTTLIGGKGPDGKALTGFVDGPANEARVMNPWGVAVSADGTVYFTDRDNNALRKYVPAR